MYKFKLIRGVMLVSLAAVIMLPLYEFIFVYPSFVELLKENAGKEAVRIARHLSRMLIKEKAELAKGILPEGFPEDIKKVKKEFDLLEVRVFSPSGEIIYSTDREDIGKINTERYFRETVSRGITYTKAVTRNIKFPDGRFEAADIVEAFVPVTGDGIFKGAFEIHLDITEREKKFDKLLSRSHAAVFVVVLALLGAAAVSSLKAAKTISGLNRAEEQIIRQRAEMETVNEELSMLNEVSTEIGRTIDMDGFLSSVLNMVTGAGIFKVERKGVIFTVEGERMKLVSHLGVSETFLDLHNDMKVGDCLCGAAVKTGEIIISKNSAEDGRHTIRYPGMSPHGHIIVPLKTANGTVGVLCLYMPAGADLDERKIRLLSSIGSQTGIAIENASLYKETKSLSLHDPLTGLANRRFMNIMLENYFAEAKRYWSSLSAIMLDIDYFKRYNDTYGHGAGDEMLVCIAEIISSCKREVDIAVRFGGEEFLILLPETEPKNACKLAERIRKIVEEKTPVTVSLGVSSFKEGMQGKEEIISGADAALYQAKEKGRNQVQVSF